MECDYKISREKTLKEVEWECLILDEAQAIKNPTTKQTKEIKKLTAHMRIAMTGTPIENDLTNLWSLFDFLNKGLMGTSKEFKEFNKQLKEHPDQYLGQRGFAAEDSGKPGMLKELCETIYEKERGYSYLHSSGRLQNIWRGSCRKFSMQKDMCFMEAHQYRSVQRLWKIRQLTENVIGELAANTGLSAEERPVGGLGIQFFKFYLLFKHIFITNYRYDSHINYKRKKEIVWKINIAIIIRTIRAGIRNITAGIRVSRSMRRNRRRKCRRQFLLSVLHCYSDWYQALHL